ncbi:hypothetical protein AURDEDRAFT_161776, partial [Auricularia subglabra TFB-10046 SS5]
MAASKKSKGSSNAKTSTKPLASPDGQLGPAAARSPNQAEGSELPALTPQQRGAITRKRNEEARKAALLKAAQAGPVQESIVSAPTGLRKRVASSKAAEMASQAAAKKPGNPRSKRRVPDEDSNSLVGQKTDASPVGKPLAPPVEKAHAPVDKPLAPPVNKPDALPIDKSPAPPVEKPLAPVDNPLAPPIEKALALPVDRLLLPVEKPLAPVEKPLAPVERSDAPPVDKPLAPVEKPLAPVDKPLAPVEKPLAPPVNKPDAPPVDELPAPP